MSSSSSAAAAASASFLCLVASMRSLRFFDFDSGCATTSSPNVERAGPPSAPQWVGGHTCFLGSPPPL